MKMILSLARVLREIRNYFSNKLRIEAWLLDGREKHSGEPFTVAYAGGLERHRIYFANLAFGPGWGERSLGREWLWRVKSRAERENHACALLVYETGVEKEALFTGSNLLRSPVWLKFEIPVEEKDLSRTARLRRRDMERKIRKHSFTSSSSRKEEDFDNFYHNMYVPYIQNRHGEMSAIQEYSLMKKEFLSGGELVFIHKDGLRIAGGVVDHSQKNSRFHCLGILDGSQEYARMGVSDALYCFQLKHIRERGGMTANLGHCRAFFGDGVFRYKVEIGARVGGGYYRPNGLLRFMPLKRTAALMSYWLNNPFVAQGKEGQYHGIIFIDRVPPVGELDKILDANFCRGVDHVTIYTLDGSTSDPVRTSSGHNIRFAAAASLLKGK